MAAFCAARKLRDLDGRRVADALIRLWRVSEGREEGGGGR